MWRERVARRERGTSFSACWLKSMRWRDRLTWGVCGSTSTRNAEVSPVGEWVIDYRPTDAGVEVSRVLHGRRDHRRAHKPDEPAKG